MLSNLIAKVMKFSINKVIFLLYNLIVSEEASTNTVRSIPSVTKQLLLRNMTQFCVDNKTLSKIFYILCIDNKHPCVILSKEW